MNNFFNIQRFAEINGTEGDDYTRNSLDAVTINALGGHDNIYNYGSEVSIDAGDGSDAVYNRIIAFICIYRDIFSKISNIIIITCTAYQRV